MLPVTRDSRSASVGRSARSQLSSRSRKLMPSRLVFICPRGTTSAGTDFSTSPPTASRSSVSRAALVWPPAVSRSTLYSSISSRQPDRLRRLPGQHHRGRTGVDHHRRVDAVDLRFQRELAALAARYLHRRGWSQALAAQHVRDAVAGARQLVGIAIGHHGACGAASMTHDEEDAAHRAASASVSAITPFHGSTGARPASAMRAGNAPSWRAVRRCPCGASARFPAACVRSRSRDWSWGPSDRLRCTAFLGSFCECGRIRRHLRKHADYNPVPALMIGLLRGVASRRPARRWQFPAARAALPRPSAPAPTSRAPAGR